MKRLNLSYINVICVFVLSFAVMEYVNLLIGRVGGFPVLAAGSLFPQAESRERLSVSASKILILFMFVKPPR